MSEINKDLLVIKEQLFDASPEIKESFNKVANYFATKSPGAADNIRNRQIDELIDKSSDKEKDDIIRYLMKYEWSEGGGMKGFSIKKHLEKFGFKLAK